MFVATSLVLLWLIILAIDGRAGAQMAAAVKSSIATNGGVAAFGQKEEVLRKVLRPNVVPVLKGRQQNEQREEAAS